MRLVPPECRPRPCAPAALAAGAPPLVFAMPSLEVQWVVALWVCIYLPLICLAAWAVYQLVRSSEARQQALQSKLEAERQANRRLCLATVEALAHNRRQTFPATRARVC